MLPVWRYYFKILRVLRGWLECRVSKEESKTQGQEDRWVVVASNYPQMGNTALRVIMGAWAPEGRRRGWGRRGKEEGEPGRSRCSPARRPGWSALGMGFLLPLLPQTLGLPSPYFRPYWVGSSQSLGEVRRAADHTPSSQSRLSVSSFQGKAESQGLSVQPRTWSNAQVFPV